MFELSVRYLLDPVGGGRPRTAIRDIYLDVGRGVPFATAFLQHMEIGLEELERRYWDLIRGYLR